MNATVRTRPRRVARGQPGAGFREICRGLVPGAVRRHPCAVHRHASRSACRRSCAIPGAAGSRPNTACCRARPHTRTDREAARGRQSGRTQEIQRLIGRSLRAVTDLAALGERQIRIDCDVIQADGGTRTAAITGSYVALYQALAKHRQRPGCSPAVPLNDSVAAMSCGMFEGARCSTSTTPRIRTARPTPISC